MISIYEGSKYILLAMKGHASNCNNTKHSKTALYCVGVATVTLVLHIEFAHLQDVKLHST